MPPYCLSGQQQLSIVNNYSDMNNINSHLSLIVDYVPSIVPGMLPPETGFGVFNMVMRATGSGDA